MQRAAGSLSLLVQAAPLASASVLLQGAAGGLAARWQQACTLPQRGYAQPAAAPAAAAAASGGSAAAAAAVLQQSIRSPSTQRTGLLAVKVGMTQEWDAWGVRVPLTVLWVDDCQVRAGNV